MRDWRSTLRTHASLGALVLMAAVAACGGGAGGAPPPQVAPASSGSEGAAIPGASGQVGAPGASAPVGSVMPSGPLLSPSSPVEMKAPVPSAMIDDLRALGLDAKNLPPIEKLEPRMLRGVMKLMAKSLGVKCGDCHQEGDFAAPTRRKKIAAHMWDEFAVKLALAEPGAADSPLFCDSCHQARVQLLDRRDKKALGKWMDDNFVVKLDANPGRSDGKSVECETCHVDMDMHFLAKWGQ